MLWQALPRQVKWTSTCCEKDVRCSLAINWSCSNIINPNDLLQWNVTLVFCMGLTLASDVAICQFMFPAERIHSLALTPNSEPEISALPLPNMSSQTLPSSSQNTKGRNFPKRFVFYQQFISDCLLNFAQLMMELIKWVLHPLHLSLAMTNDHRRARSLTAVAAHSSLTRRVIKNISTLPTLPG